MKKNFVCMLLAGTMFSVSVAKADDVVVVEAQAIEIERPVKFDRNHHKAMAAQLANDLGLTEEQKVLAEKNRIEGHKKIAPLMDQMMSLRQKIDQERRANMLEFEKILTPEQKERFNVIKERHKKFREGPRDMGDPKLMRGMHKVGPHGAELAPRDPKDLKNKSDFKAEKHHKKKGHHKSKGGFMGDLKPAQEGGFVDPAPKAKGGFVEAAPEVKDAIDRENVYLDGGNTSQK